MKKLTSLVVFCLFVGILGAQVTDVRIDFGTTMTAPTNANGIWNSVAQSAASFSLLNANGTTSGATLWLYNVYGSTAGAITSGWSTMNGTLYGDDNWLEDYAAADSWEANPGWNSFYLQLTGLNDAKQYRIDLVGSDSYHYTGADVGNYTINSVFADTTQSGTGGPNSSQNWSQVTGGYVNQDWMVWSSVSPASGVFELVVTFGAGFSGINAMRVTDVTAVPEPAALSLLGGILVLVLVGLRRPQT